MKDPLLPALLTSGLLPVARHAALIATENSTCADGNLAGQAGGTGCWNDKFGAPRGGSSLRLACGHTTSWDALKIGTTFADVAAVPEPSVTVIGRAGVALPARRRHVRAACFL